MNSANDLYRKRQGQSPSACPPDPCVCSTCGMLECLCRPRFFAGQILTADDLNRLDGYIRGKHRLHNRQLHGWGVVNGLEVTCNPCGDGVMVSCGYALSPCGDDIVVCDAVSVDVCELIRRCKDSERKWVECDPPRPPKQGPCEAGDDDWILAIRYAETPVRGVKPLRAAADCTENSCACGGSGGKCGCGGACGGGKCACTPARPARPRGAPVQCEPTVICEGFAFEVYRKPPANTDDDKDNNVLNPQSELRKRFDCCTKLLLTQMPQLPGPIQLAATEAEALAWYQWVVKARAQLRRYFQTHGSYNCELLRQFDAIPMPPAGTLANAGAILLAVILLAIVWFDAILSCFCSALLPPCPAPSSEVRVPLASIHITGKPCRVARICNWTIHRKIATTFPSLQYWLSMLPFGTMLRQMLDTVCCFDFGAILNQGDYKYAAAAGVAENNGADVKNYEAGAAWQHANAMLNPTIERPQPVAGAFGMLSAALGRSGQQLEFSTLVESFMLRADKRDPEIDYLSAVETANLPQFLAANEFMRPAVTEALGPALSLLTRLPKMMAGAAPADNAAPDALASMKTQLAALQKSVQAQAEEIARIKEGRPPQAPRGKRKPPG